MGNQYDSNTRGQNSCQTFEIRKGKRHQVYPSGLTAVCGNRLAGCGIPAAPWSILLDGDKAARQRAHPKTVGEVA